MYTVLSLGNGIKWAADPDTGEVLVGTATLEPEIVFDAVRCASDIQMIEGVQMVNCDRVMDAVPIEERQLMVAAIQHLLRMLEPV